MLCLPPGLADCVEQLRVRLVEITAAEQTCLTNAVAGVSQGKGLPQVQAVMARCRQTSAAAAATAIDTFRDECSELGTRANPSTSEAIVAATAKNVSDFWAKSESLAAAFASEAAALLPAQGLDKTTQVIKNLCSDRVSSINHYFEQLTA
jgi:murein L,D-transpeptidase YcbB/YkuD